MRDQRKAERLADYYRRNFREYINFDSGAAKNRVRTTRPCSCVVSVYKMLFHD